ncbi:hypothetical protein BDZ94DRAFT_1268250 [Collybia nuda]|uniref:Uncharacterized protein n=1 Tax=Collybia nuda TaxID=64659 RepID=A0A9P5XXJ9_9AGAR|nr:hypothetical protein BDZ94DRAFT_1268250 [Collybia nuda]
MSMTVDTVAIILILLYFVVNLYLYVGNYTAKLRASDIPRPHLLQKLSVRTK